jgi:hypothetical protein
MVHTHLDKAVTQFFVQLLVAKKKLYPHRRQCLMLADIVTRFPGSLKSHLVAAHSDEINTGKI